MNNGIKNITLKAARVNAGYTRNQIAEMLGVSKVTVGNWENGSAKPSMAVKILLSQLYKVPMDFIVFP